MNFRGLEPKFNCAETLSFKNSCLTSKQRLFSVVSSARIRFGCYFRPVVRVTVSEMSLFSETPLSNVTVYRREFQKKTVPRTRPILQVPDYKDPLSGPYEEYILPYRKYNCLHEPKDYPDPKEYAEEVCKRNPGLERYLKNRGNGPDFDVIDRLYDDYNRTVYMTSYCCLGDFESKVKESRNTSPLPDGWDIPLTTQKRCYRDPKLLIPAGISATSAKSIPDNLRPNEKERAILGVKTGVSDYMAHIGRTGEEIIEGKLHGDANARPQFSQDELLRAMLIRRE